jgi:Asp-tRNA(Asn)/Glu-tRNA(Gln) amidotransferase A subunit family amidase
MDKVKTDATALADQVKAGLVRPEQLVSDALSKISAANPRLHAATEILETDARRQLDNLPDSPLRGLPISIKECYAIAGKRITSGSKRMQPIECKNDATVVKKLKAAGAVVVARGNTSEFLLGRETNNLLYGTTENAILPGLTAGGSSGGDGTMTAAGLVAFGIGTDIGGSCRYPAVFNGIVGFKPASGQIDKTGIFPSAANAYAETTNSPGILCRSVRDARLVYNVIGNKPLSAGDTGNAKIYTSASFKVKIAEAAIREALQSSETALKNMGLPVKDIDIPESGDHYKDFVSFIVAGFGNKIYEWSVTPDGRKLSIAGELLNRLKGKPTISDELFAMLLPFKIFKPSAGKLNKIINKTEAIRQKYYSLFGENGVLLLPTMGILAPRHKKFIPQYNKPGVIEIITPVSFCNVYNLSCITLPAWNYQHDKRKNPPGIQLITAPGNEELLLNVAERLEKHLRQA